MSIALASTRGSESSLHTQLVLPHLVTVAILCILISIAWVFGMVGTDTGIVGAASTVTQYIFGIMLMIHAIVLLILTMIRTRDTRNSWTNLLNRLTGRSGKYAFAEDVFLRKSNGGNAEAIGLESSGQLTSEGSTVKKNLNAEDVSVSKKTH